MLVCYTLHLTPYTLHLLVLLSLEHDATQFMLVPTCKTGSLHDPTGSFDSALPQWGGKLTKGIYLRHLFLTGRLPLSLQQNFPKRQFWNSLGPLS